MSGSEALRATDSVRPALELAVWWKDQLLDVTQVRRARDLRRARLSQEAKSLLARAAPSDARWAELVDACRAKHLQPDARDPAEVATAHALRLTVRPVSVPPRAKQNALRDSDFAFFKLVSIGILAGAAIVVAFLLMPIVEADADDLVFSGRPATLATKLFVPKPLPLPVVGGGGELVQPRTPRGGSGAIKRKVKAEDAGLLAILKDSGGELGAAFAPGLGDSIDDAMKRVGRVASAPTHGFGGLSSRGTGPGGGGTGAALSIGSGGTLGAGFGPVGLSGSQLRARGSTVVLPAKVQVVGGLDRDQIARVIRLRQSEVKHCYEAALSQQPELKGKVAVQFVIDGTGSIASASISETTLDHAGVEECILARIRQWRFPEPRGGGEVAVNFPWILRPAGTD